MEWKEPERKEGGARGSYQDSANGEGYSVVFTIKEDGWRVFTASYRGSIFATLYTDSTDGQSLRDFARCMRAMCGFHNNGRKK